MKQRANLRSPLFIQYASLPAESESTNLQIRSEEFDNSAWGKSRCTITANQIEAPDGSLTADKALCNASGSCSLTDAIAIGSTDDITFSTFIKRGNAQYCSVGFFDLGFSSSYRVVFDLHNEVITYELVQGSVFTNTSVSVEKYSNGWFRICTSALSTGTTNIRNYIYPVVNGPTSFDATSWEYSYVWGAQAELQRTCSSYIPTTSASVLRSATTSADTSSATAELKIWSGSIGYTYDRVQHATDNIDMAYSTLGGGDTVTMTQDYATAPDGTFTANRMQADNLGSGYSLLNLPKPTATGNNDEYVASVYVKSNTSSDQVFAFYGNNSQNYGPRVFTATNEWQRFDIPSQESGTSNYAYLGTNSSLSSDNAVDLLVWGYQYEQGTQQVTDFMPNETSSSLVVPALSSSDEPTEATYSLTNNPVNGVTTFEVAELIRDYIDQTNTNTSGTVWAKITLSDGVQLPIDYSFLCTEGYISSYEPVQTYLNAPNTEALLQSNRNVIIAEGESMNVPVYAKYASYYTKTTSGSTIAAVYFDDLMHSESQIDYINITSDDTLIELYADASLIETITIEKAECSKYANNRLMFVNKYGAKQEFFVNMKSIEKIRVKDSGFNRNVINYNTLSIDNGIHGYKRNVSETRESFTLNTPFLDEGNVQAFEELLLSEYVWMSKDGSNYTPVTVKDNSMTRKTHLNDKLIQYTINVESSFNLINNQR